jgi:putative SOS response-associated peptidase YedK
MTQRYAGTVIATPCNSMINAKADTLTSKPAFREAFKARRCIVPADGYCEWQKIDAKTKQPYRFALRDGGLMGFAGLWEVDRQSKRRDGSKPHYHHLRPQTTQRAHPRPDASNSRRSELWSLAWRRFLGR